MSHGLFNTIWFDQCCYPLNYEWNFEISVTKAEGDRWIILNFEDWSNFIDDDHMLLSLTRCRFSMLYQILMKKRLNTDCQFKVIFCSDLYLFVHKCWYSQWNRTFQMQDIVERNQHQTIRRSENYCSSLSALSVLLSTFSIHLLNSPIFCYHFPHNMLVDPYFIWNFLLSANFLMKSYAATAMAEKNRLLLTKWRVKVKILYWIRDTNTYIII